MRPIIFISAVSRELRSARQLVANTLQLLAYEPDWQDIFGTEEGDLRGMLRRKVDSCSGVIQLVGQCYGAEPKNPEEQFGRVSYTQYEALYAKQRGKKVWYFLLDADFATDQHDAEPDELRELQRAYRQRIAKGEQLYYPLASTDALENKVLRLRNDLAALRRRGKQWAIGVLALLILIIGLVGWIIQRQVALSAKFDKILAQGIAQYPATETKVRQSQPGQKPEEIEERTYADLSKTLGIDEKALRERLPQFAQQLRNAPNVPTFERANAAYVAKDYNEAERLALAAADEARKASPPKVSDAIKALELAGNSADARIEYARALQHYRAAAQLTDRSRNPLQWAGQQWNIAFMLAKQGKYSDAEAVYKSALSEYERARSDDDPKVLRLRNDLANTLLFQGKYAESEAQSREVIKLREKVLGPEHPHTLGTRNNLANALLSQGKYAEAEAQYREVVKLEEKVLGPEHPDTLTTRDNLSSTLSQQGKYADAEVQYREVIKLREKVLGPEHPDTLRTRSNLASALNNQGKYTDSETECREVIKLEEKVLGPEHPITLATRESLAIALDDQEQHAQAEAEFREVIKLEEKVLGPEHPNTLRTRNNLANALREQGKYVDSETQYREVIKLSEKVLGPEHPVTLGMRNNLAAALRNQGKYAEAEAQYREIIKLSEKVLGIKNPNTLVAYFNLARCLKSEAKIDEARQFAQRAAEGATRVLGANHPNTLKFQKLAQELQKN